MEVSTLVMLRTVGDVNFIENVKHLSISESALTASDFDYSKGDGHINSSSSLPQWYPSHQNKKPIDSNHFFPIFSFLILLMKTLTFISFLS